MSYDWLKKCIVMQNPRGGLEWNMCGCVNYITKDVIDASIKRVKELKSTPGRIVASNIEFSKCQLSNEHFGMVLRSLMENDIGAQRLKFFQNHISDVKPLVAYLQSATGKMTKEVHLSHNKLDDAKVNELLSGCMSQGFQKPVYLRLEKNLCSNPSRILSDFNGRIAVVKRVGDSFQPGVEVIVHETFFGNTTSQPTMYQPYNQQWAPQMRPPAQAVPQINPAQVMQYQQQQQLQQQMAYAQQQRGEMYGYHQGFSKPTRDNPAVLEHNGTKGKQQLIYPVSAPADPSTSSGAQPAVGSKKCTNCSYLCTGVVAGYCCRMCKENNTHGPQCRKQMFPTPGAETSTYSTFPTSSGSSGSAAWDAETARRNAKRRIPVPPSPADARYSVVPPSPGDARIRPLPPPQQQRPLPPPPPNKRSLPPPRSGSKRRREDTHKRAKSESSSSDSSSSQSSFDYTTKAAPPTAKSCEPHGSAKSAKSRPPPPPPRDVDTFFVESEQDKEYPEWSLRWLKEAESKPMKSAPPPSVRPFYYLDMTTMELTKTPPASSKEEKRDPCIFGEKATIVLLAPEEITHVEVERVLRDCQKRKKENERARKEVGTRGENMNKKSLEQKTQIQYEQTVRKEMVEKPKREIVNTSNNTPFWGVIS